MSRTYARGDQVQYNANRKHIKPALSSAVSLPHAGLGGVDAGDPAPIHKTNGPAA